MTAAVWQWIRKRERLLAYGLGSSVIALWTLLRFFTQRTIFDLVSQQVIVHQWLHGTMTAAHMGLTAYVPKMLLLYVPLDLLPGSPRLKLILLTLAVNITTFVLLGLVAEKILREFGVPIRRMFYAALLWLSVIAGSVFWIEFTNSRNLEVVGGLFWIYLGLRHLRRPSWRLLIGMVAFGSLLFFDDPLQFYMSALPLAAYAVGLLITKKHAVKTVAELVGVTLVAYLGSKLVFVSAEHLLQLSFSDTGGSTVPHINLAWMRQSVTGSAKSALSLFAGDATAGQLRKVLNLGLLLLGVVGMGYAFLRRLMPQRLAALIGCMVVIDMVVYVLGGQAVQGAATSRYLIMLAPAFLVAVGTVQLPRNAQRPVAIVLACVVCLNLATLGGTLQKRWDISFPQDAHIESAYRYTLAHPEVHAYASADTAMSLLYLHNLPAAKMLPVGCLAGRVVSTHYSMDREFARNARAGKAIAAIVFDGEVITNNPNACTPATIATQLGKPLALQRSDDGSLIMLYRQSNVRLPD